MLAGCAEVQLSMLEQLLHWAQKEKVSIISKCIDDNITINGKNASTMLPPRPPIRAIFTNIIGQLDTNRQIKINWIVTQYRMTGNVLRKT